MFAPITKDVPVIVVPPIVVKFAEFAVPDPIVPGASHVAPSK